MDIKPVRSKGAKQSLYLVRRFLPYYKPYRGVLAADLCCAALTTVCELVLPLINAGKQTQYQRTDFDDQPEFNWWLRNGCRCSCSS